MEALRRSDELLHARAEDNHEDVDEEDVDVDVDVDDEQRRIVPSLPFSLVVSPPTPFAIVTHAYDPDRFVAHLVSSQ